MSLIDLIREKGGSTMRLVLVFSFAICLGVWAIDSVYSIFHQGHAQDLPKNVMELLVGISAAKVGQRWVENKSNTTLK